MTKELHTTATPGTTIYCVVRNAQGQPWNQTSGAFENYTEADWGVYALVLSEQSPSGYFVGDFPTGVVDKGHYPIDFRQQQGASPAASDPSIGGGVLEWTGTAEAGLIVPNASGQVQVDLSEAISTGATGNTLGRALLAALAQGVGVWKYRKDLTPNTLEEYTEDGLTLIRSFPLTLDSSGNVTQRG